MNRTVVVPGGFESRCWRRVAFGAIALLWSACGVGAQSVAELQSEAAAQKAAAAQSEEAAQSGELAQSRSDGIERHGWAVLPMGEGFALVHLPPRTEVVGSEGFSAHAEDGEMAIVKELSRAPERVVGSGRTAFLIFEARSDPGDAPMRSVLSVTARPTPMGGRWATDSGGRLTGRAAIAGSRVIVDAVGFRFEGGNQDQCAVLLAEADGGAGAGNGAGAGKGEGAGEVGTAGQSMIDLLVLDGSAWVRVALPVGLAAPDHARLVASERGLLLVARARDGSGWVGWRGTVKPGVTTFPEPTGDPGERLLPVRSLPTVRWTAAGPWAGFDVEGDATILEIDGSIVTTRLEPAGRWVVRAARDGAMVEVLSREVRGRAMALVATGVGSSTRLVLIMKDRAKDDISPERSAQPQGDKRPDPGEGDDAEAQKLRSGLSGLVAGLRLVEVSAVTGRVLYDGPSHDAPLISSSEYLLLIVVVIAAVVGVLVFVLLPDPDDGVVTLPDGAALAEPFRRVAAGAADVALAMLLASWGLGFAADSGLIEHTAGDLWTLVMTLVFAYTHGVLGEWALGRTVGKVLLGCKVVGTRRRGSWRVGLRQALMRNLVKFAMPPVAVFGLSDANGRHRGDVLAGTVVVIRINDEAGDDERDDGREAESGQGAVDETGSDEESGEHSKEERGGSESDDG